MASLLHPHQRFCSGPFVAHTTDSRHSISPRAYDCVTIHIVRNGSVILTSGDLQRPIRTGDIVLVAPLASTGCIPEGVAEVTTLLIDTDYLTEHLFWHHLDLLPDRDAARDLAAKLHPDPIQIISIGEREIDDMGPTLDELVARTKTRQDAAGYFHAHALLFTVLEAVTARPRHAPVEGPSRGSRERAARMVPPRWRVFRPARHEATQAVALMRGNMAKRWRVEDLAAHACLSVSQFQRVFRATFGVSPMTYLSILRVLEMARLIRETNESIAIISEHVGWALQDGQASRSFRRYMGTSPSNYRRHGPPTASADGPGIAVAQAARNFEESVGRGIAT